jgi:hypothetical protein
MGRTGVTLGAIAVGEVNTSPCAIRGSEMLAAARLAAPARAPREVQNRLPSSRMRTIASMAQIVVMDDPPSR